MRVSCIIGDVEFKFPQTTEDTRRNKARDDKMKKRKNSPSVSTQVIPIFEMLNNTTEDYSS